MKISNHVYQCDYSPALMRKCESGLKKEKKKKNSSHLMRTPSITSYGTARKQTACLLIFIYDSVDNSCVSGF